MAVKISYVDVYKDYGKCLKMENDAVELLVTVEVGPRIIYFAAKGGENMFWNDDNKVRVSKHPLYKSIFGEDAEYHFYGGHRMWLAPQSMCTESPDSYPVTVDILENGASFTCPEAKVMGFISKLTVILDPEEPTITVTTAFTNTADEPKSNAVWQVTQCAPGGVAFFPYMKPAAPMTPGARRPMSMDPERARQPMLPAGNLVTFIGGSDDRLIVDPEYITLSFSYDRDRRPIKVGMQNQQNFALYAVNDHVLKFGYDNDPFGVYTDYGCSQETYTDSQFTEVEALGQYVTFSKGETIEHTETISILDQKAPVPDLKDRAAVKAFVELYK